LFEILTNFENAYLTETLIRIPMSVIGRFSLMASSLEKMLYYKIVTGGFLLAFSVSKLPVYSILKGLLQAFSKFENNFK
jgi:hypothetical protein